MLNILRILSSYLCKCHFAPCSYMIKNTRGHCGLVICYDKRIRKAYKTLAEKTLGKVGEDNITECFVRMAED